MKDTNQNKIKEKEKERKEKKKPKQPQSHCIGQEVQEKESMAQLTVPGL